MKNDELKKAYQSQMQQMSNRARAWLKSNSTQSPWLEWRLPSIEYVVITDAIRDKAVWGNRAGITLLKFVCTPWLKTDREPTARMAKEVIDGVCAKRPNHSRRRL